MASDATSTTTPRSTAPHTHTPGADADPNSSSSTLVNHGLASASASPSAHEPSSSSSSSSHASPFSDLHASTPTSTPTPTPTPTHALQGSSDGPLYPIPEREREREVRPCPGAGATDANANALWANRLSESFGAIADQIAAASRALAAPPQTDGAGEGGLAARLDAIERAQERLGADVREVQAQLARLLNVQGSAKRAEKEEAQAEVAIVEVQSTSTSGVGEGAGEEGAEFKRATEAALEELRKKVDGAVEAIKLEQARLYARLHNATVGSNKMGIKAPMMANGKPPQNFPNTKGEFEHLTKERYEHILKSYDIVPKGDTKAKREQLREFIGLTPASN